MPTGKPSEKPALTEIEGCLVALNTNVLLNMPFVSLVHSEDEIHKGMRGENWPLTVH